jgi:hypothetical protein
MNVNRDRELIEIHSVHSAHNSPIAKLCARFGSMNEPRVPAPLMPAGDVSPWDFPPDAYERWEERVCIMHFDGKLPWPEAEALALVDVLGQIDLKTGCG